MIYSGLKRMSSTSFYIATLMQILFSQQDSFALVYHTVNDIGLYGTIQGCLITSKKTSRLALKQATSGESAVQMHVVW